MLRINPAGMPIPKLHGYLPGAVAPRPITFAGTMDVDGNSNLFGKYILSESRVQEAWKTLLVYN